jgi:hypothetical protein
VSTESYVLRIYRRSHAKRQSIVGVVEAVNSGWQKPFQSFEELADILATPDVPVVGGALIDRRDNET